MFRSTSLLCFHSSLVVRLVAALLLLTAWPAAQAATCRATTTGSAGNDGSSWSLPLDLQSALADSNCTEVWVKTGVYKPVVPANLENVTDAERAARFDVPPGVAIYGGFAGNELTRAQRDPDTQRTVLSGDVDGNDVVDADGVTMDASDIAGDNSYQVMVMNGTTGSGIGPDTLLDGLTITAGSAMTLDQWGGGGLFCAADDAGGRCSPTLSNLRFAGNEAYSGGAMYFLGGEGEASPTLLRVVVRGNEATGTGGGLVADAASASASGQSRVTIVGARFSDNRTRFAQGGVTTYAGNGGGAIATLVSGTGLPSLLLDITDTTFANNSSAAQGGAIAFASPAFPGSPTSGLALSNATFVGNHADYNGGAIAVAGGSSAVTATLRNVTLVDNTAGLDGGALVAHGIPSGNTSLVLDLDNTILWGNVAANSGSQLANDGFITTIDHGLVQGGCPASAGCTALVTGDPQLGALADNGGFTRTILPAAGSAAIDAGNDASCTAQDQRGIQRPQGWHCDIGAVEVGGQPVLTVSDGNDYARYGQTIHYVVSLRNPGSASFTGVAVASAVPSQLDGSATHWVCLSAASLCSSAGNGPLNDANVGLPPYGAISWVVSAPVREDASEAGGIQFTVTADSADLELTSSDTDALGLFRDGFDVSGANGTQAVAVEVPGR